MLCYDCGAIVATNIVNLSNTVVPVVSLFVLVCGRGFCVYLCAFEGSGSVSSFFFLSSIRNCLLAVTIFCGCPRLSFDCVIVF